MIEAMNRNSAWSYFLITFTISWIPLVTSIAAGLSAKSPAGIICIALGGIGPAAGAAAILVRKGNESLRREYLSRLGPGLITGRWYMVVLILPVLISAAAVLISMPFGSSIENLFLTKEFVENPLSLITFAAFVFFFGPLTEELGWRGYALDSLKSRSNGLAASLILSIFWALWHLPLFFIEGYPLAEMFHGTEEYILYYSDFFPKCVLYTWIYYKTGRSILSAILFHFMNNYIGMIIEIGPAAEAARVSILYLSAMLIIFYERGIFLKMKD